MFLELASRSNLRKVGYGFVVFAVSYLCVAVQVSLTQPTIAPDADALGYVRLADNLTHRNVLAIAAESLDPTPFFPPLYPLFLSGIAHLDDTFATALRCFGARTYAVETSNCALEFGLAKYAQLGLAALTLSLIWFAGISIFRSVIVAGVGVACVLASGRLAFYANLLLTENLFIPAFAAASFALASAVRTQKPVYYFVAGIAIGLVALTRPSGQYCYFAVAFVLFFVGAFQFLRARSGCNLIAVCLLTVGYVSVISPWLVRNHQQFGAPFLTRGYASFILVERVAYNSMNWREFGVSFSFWLPGPGESLARKIFDENDYRRLTFEAEDSFYLKGTGRNKSELRRAFPEPKDQLNYLLREEVFGNWFKHSIVTIAMTYRGVWIVKYWTIIAVPALFALLIYGAVRRRHLDFLAFALPAVFMLLLQAAVSVSMHRYNIILLPSLALASGWFVQKLLELPVFHRVYSGICERFQIGSLK